jgi:hypothetical protein
MKSAVVRMIRPSCQQIVLLQLTHRGEVKPHVAPSGGMMRARRRVCQPRVPVRP